MRWWEFVNIFYLKVEKWVIFRFEVNGSLLHLLGKNPPFFQHWPQLFWKILTIQPIASRNAGCIDLDHISLKFQPNRRVTLHIIALYVSLKYVLHMRFYVTSIFDRIFYVLRSYAYGCVKNPNNLLPFFYVVTYKCNLLVF